MKHPFLYACLAAFAGLLAPRVESPGRHILLADDGMPPGLVRFLSTRVELAEGAKTTWVTLTRTGTFTDPRYGQFEITPAMLLQMVSNFDARVVGQDIFLDVAHKPSDGSAAKVLKLAVEGGRLRALVEWTAFGLDAVRKRGFAYLSAEYHENWRDNEQGNPHGCVLLAAGLTTRPVIKNLDPVQLSESDADGEAKTAIHPNLIKSLEFDTMNKHLLALKTKLLSLGLTEEQIKPIIAAAEKQLSAEGLDEARSLAMVDTFTAAGEALHTQLKTLSATGAPHGPITLQMGGGLDAAAVALEVNRVLAQAATTAATDSATLAAKVKLLSDTVLADKTLSEADKTTLVTDLTPLVTKELSDAQVTGMAAMMLSQANRTSAAFQLATLGYRPPSGNLHISVDGGNQVRALQVQMDKRLGYEGMSDHDRYARTGGHLLPANNAFAEKCLAQFDQEHGQRLHNEHKMLAGGMTGIADAAVPAAVERTVLRETLYQILGLSLCDVGTYPFASVVQVFYSYRDQTAAGINDTRTYELGAIQNSGVIETFEEARPIPQKLAMKISNEVQYLLQAAPIDYDPLAENIRNIIRITAEDTDRIVQNELINANDEALLQTFTETLTAQVNGTNRTFVTAAFPVVRPRSIFDLKGALVGSVQNPIVVTLNGTVRQPYTRGTLAAGLYYICDYNLGEWRFVNELGVAQTPTSGWVLTITGSQTLNVAKHDLYPGTLTPTLDQIAAVYDQLLTVMGSRKVVVENDRNYMANLLLQSGAIDNALGQAKTFQANSSRAGTNLNPDGSIGRVKDMPAFNTRAPGLLMGDTRVLIGERGNTRFRMLRPFQMKAAMQEMRDSNGNFIGAGQNYGEQFIACHTPTMRKNATTSVVLYNSAARIARV